MIEKLKILFVNYLVCKRCKCDEDDTDTIPVSPKCKELENDNGRIKCIRIKTQIRSYTETDSNVLSDSVLENIILNAQYRIFRDVPIDADRKQQLGNFVAGQESINCPAGAVIY